MFCHERTAVCGISTKIMLNFLQNDNCEKYTKILYFYFDMIIMYISVYIGEIL